MVIVEISQKWKKLFTCLQIITEISPKAEVRLKMQIEGLNFLKVQKSMRAKSMNQKKKKISDENKGRLSNNEVFGFSMVLGEKMSSI